MKFFERFKQLNRMSFFNKNLGKSQRYTGFTLAEVLIVLGIIGVVAEMTIPTLINTTKEAEYKTGYKKAFSVASQALMMASTNGEIQQMSSWADGPNRVANFNAMKKYFKVATECNTDDTQNDISKCWDRSGDLYFGTLPDTSSPAFVDVSGMAWTINGNDNNINSGAELIVDINGLKGPNRFGQDRFLMAPGDGTDGTNYTPIKIESYPDCLGVSTTDCHFSTSYTNVCPSVAKHPCYYQSWLTGGGK